jgi:hypothetical protein
MSEEAHNEALPACAQPAPHMTFRSSRIVYYGPHACQNCGVLICKMGFEFGGNAFTYPEGPIYPNTEWHPHVCDPRRVAMLPSKAQDSAQHPENPPTLLGFVAGLSGDAHPLPLRCQHEWITNVIVPYCGKCGTQQLTLAPSGSYSF